MTNIRKAYQLIAFSYFLYDRYECIAGGDILPDIELKIIRDKDYLSSSEFLETAVIAMKGILHDFELDDVEHKDNTFINYIELHRAFNFFLSECFPQNGMKLNFYKSTIGGGLDKLFELSAALYNLAICYCAFPIIAKQICKHKKINNSDVQEELDHLRECIMLESNAALARAGQQFMISKAQSKKGRKMRNINGLTPDERLIRNDKILKDFTDTKLSLNNFAINEGKKHKLSPSMIKKVIKSHLNT